MKYNKILNLSLNLKKIASIFDKDYFNSLSKFDRKINDRDSFGAENFLSDSRKEYLNSLGLQKIDEGGTRSIYALSPKLVLKLAHNPYGINGNKNEFENYQKTKSIFFRQYIDAQMIFLG